MKKRLAAIVRNFSRIKVVVMGDIISDEYLFGLTSRVSREAPVLILRYNSGRLLLGGAANTANNIRALGGKPVLIGVVGDDRAGEELIRVMKDSGLDTNGVIRVKGRPTTVKTRILAGGLHTSRQQVIRIDREIESPVGRAVEKKLIKNAVGLLKNAQSLLVSDYGLGAVTNESVRQVNGLAGDKGKIITVDSRSRLLQFKGVTGATPNEPEAEEALRMELPDDRKVLEGGAILLRMIGSKSLLITRGKKGMALFERGRQPRLIPIYGSDEVADVTGAGDTVIGTFTLALSSGATPYEAALIATYAAGIVVMKQGTATVTRQELLHAIKEDKTLING